MSDAIPSFQPAAPRKLSPIDAITRGVDCLRADFGASLGMCLFLVAIQCAGIIPYLGLLIGLLVTPAAYGGCYRFALEAVRGQRPTFEVVMSGFKRWWPVTLTFGLMSALPLLVAAPTLGIAGAMGMLSMMGRQVPDLDADAMRLMPALIVTGVICIPAAIWLTYRLMLAVFLAMEDQPLSPIEAVKRSWAMTRGSWWRIFGFQWLCALVTLAGFLMLCVGVFAALPVVFYALAHVYEQLRAREAEAVPPPA